MEHNEKEETVQSSLSPLIVGSLTGSLIGITLVLCSVSAGDMVDLSVMLFAAAILGFVTGGIFAPITALFILDMEMKKVVIVLAGGTFTAGILTIIIGFIRTGENLVILSYPIGILGYWFSFVFRKELVWIINRIMTKRDL